MSCPTDDSVLFGGFSRLSVDWAGRDDADHPPSSGMYFCRLSTAAEVGIRTTMMKLR